MDEEKTKNEEIKEEQESNAARRLRMMGYSAEEENEKEASLPPAKKDFSNFWYHNKTKVLVFGFLAIVIAIGLWQMLTREKPDIYIMYAGPTYVDNIEAEAMTDAFKSVAKDYNGDGSTVVNFMQADIFSEEQKEEYKAKSGSAVDNKFNSDEKMRFENEMSAGESVVCLLDPWLYDEIKDSGVLLSIKEVMGYEPDCLNDEYSIKLSETAFSEYYSSFDVFPDDTLLVIRRATVMTAFKGDKAEQAHKDHVDFFKKLVNFRAPAENEEGE